MRQRKRSSEKPALVDILKRRDQSFADFKLEHGDKWKDVCHLMGAIVPDEPVLPAVALPVQEDEPEPVAVKPSKKVRAALVSLQPTQKEPAETISSWHGESMLHVTNVTGSYT